MKNFKKKDKVISDWFDLINERCKPGEIIELPVLSGSMMPSLIPGKKIMIKYTHDPDINIGNIIIFKDGRALTAHRILLKISFMGKRLIYQKGDMNRFGNWIKKEKIIGLVNSAQNSNNKIIDLASKSAKKTARIIALKQIVNVLFNIILILPRNVKKKVKDWLLKIKMNFD